MSKTTITPPQGHVIRVMTRTDPGGIERGTSATTTMSGYLEVCHSGIEPTRVRESTLEKLFRLTSKGKEESRKELLAKLAADAQAVGIFFDMWKVGDKEVGDLLKDVDVGHHARNAIIEPHAVFALSLLREARNEAAASAMRDLDAVDLAQLATKEKYAVFALTHLREADNEGVSMMMEWMDVQFYRHEALRDPYAVYALSHLAEAQNSKALRAMRKLPIEGLLEHIDDDPHVANALRLLAEKGNVESLIEIANREGGESLDLTDANLETVALDEETKEKLLDALESLMRSGNETSIDLVERLASHVAWAVWLLDKVKFSIRGIVDRMRSIDVSRYEMPAKSHASVVFALQLLALEQHEGATEIMRTLDPAELARKALDSDDQFIFNALTTLVRYENEDAVEALFELSKKTVRARRELKELARGAGPMAAKIKQRLQKVSATPTQPPDDGEST